MKNAKPMPDPDHIRSCFHYDGKILIWKHRPRSHFDSDRSANMWNAKFAGTVAGRVQPTGKIRYIQIGLDKKRYLAHRLILAMHDISIPDVVDHVNGDPLDNSIENLRPVSQKENMLKAKRKARS